MTRHLAVETLEARVAMAHCLALMRSWLEKSKTTDQRSDQAEQANDQEQANDDRN